MSNTKIVVDAGIIKEYLKTGQGRLPSAYEKYKMVISTSTYVELLASSTFEDHTLEKEVIQFIDKYFTVESDDKKTALVASRILRKYKVTLAQANTVAIALTQAISLMADDKKPYEGIADLQII